MCIRDRGNMVMGDTRIDALDNSLFDKLQVFDGYISPMLEPDNNAIDIAVSLDDYGNLLNPEYYPKVGDTITATYADDVKYLSLIHIYKSTVNKANSIEPRKITGDVLMVVIPASNWVERKTTGTRTAPMP